MYKIKLDGTRAPKFSIQDLTLNPNGATYELIFPASPGADGYALVTDGTGALRWEAFGAAQDSTVPYFIPDSVSFTVPMYKQALFRLPITIDGTMVIDGLLCEV